MNQSTEYQSLPESLLEHAKYMKAESLLAHVIAGGYPREEFAIGTGQFFERSYGNDLTGASSPEDLWWNGLVRVQLSRPGFYDMLPEGLFFQPAGVEYNSATGAAEMAALHRWNRTKEKGIRNFFLPFEHGSFYQLLQLEEEERSLLKKSEKGMLHRYFRAFWELPGQINDVTAWYFILLIPHAHQIAGCIPLMQECLGLLLDEPVEIIMKPPQLTRVAGDMEVGLGEQSLGNDTVCGSWFMEGYPSWQYVIGPLEQEKVIKYLPGGEQYEVIETFNRMFVPAEAMTETRIEIDRLTAVMELKPGKEPIMGYASL